MTKAEAKVGGGAAASPEARPAQRLLGGVKVINVGLAEFAADLEASGTPVTHVAWAPPAQGDPELARLLAKLGP